MAACSSCGRDNPEGFRFCGFCRAPLANEEVVELRKVVTVLFTDLTGFTPLAERLDAEAVRAIQGRFLHAMKAVAERHGGTVEKFIGDAVMVVFGVPTVHEDDALRAVRAAAEMRDELARLNEGLRADYGIELAAHTGLNTGEVIVEEGSAERLATGDAVNVAARLEQVAEPGEILIGEETYRLTRAAVEAEPVPARALKGKAAAVNAYRVTSVDPLSEGYLRRLDTPLVGRESELAEILAAFDRASTERGCELVTIVASPGVGKSRLTIEAVTRIAARGRVLIGRCLPYGDGITFWPIAEAVREAAGIRDEDSPEAAAGRIQALVPGEEGSRVAARVAAAIGIGAGEDLSLRETFWAVRRLLEALANDRALMLVVEDVHWAEPALLDLLEYVVEFTREHPLLILCTARPELRQTRPEWVTLGTTIALDPLSEEQSERLVQHLLGGAAFPREVVRHVVTVAEGNALFVEELVRKLIDDGSLVRSNAHWEVRGDLETLSTPGTISALLAARIDSLADGERSTIQRGAVVGRVFWWGAVQSLAPELDRPAVGRHLQTLVRKGLIQPDRSSFGGEDAFAFRHILVRDAAYESTPKTVRADLHERFADWLDHAAGDRANEYEEIVGYHLEQAVLQRASLGRGRDDLLARHAGRRLMAAGRRAAARGDNAAAANLLGRAVDVLPAEAAERADALASAGMVLLDAGELHRAMQVLDEAIERAGRSGDARLEHLARIRRTYVFVHIDVRQNLDEPWGEAEQSLAVLESVGDPESVAEGLTLVGMGLFYRGRVTEGLGALERAIELARANGLTERFNWAARLISMLLSQGETPVAAAIEYLQALLAEVQPASSYEAQLHRALGDLHALGGSEEEARTHLGRAMDMATGLDLSLIEGSTYRAVGEMALAAGRLEDAERTFRSGVDLYERLHDPAHGTTLASLLATTLALQGRLDEARAFAEVAERWLSPDDVDGVTGFFCAQAEIALAEGDAERARTHALAAIAPVDQTEYLSGRAEARIVLVRALLALGRRDEARSILEEAIAMAERKGNRRVLRAASGLLQQGKPDGSPT